MSRIALRNLGMTFAEPLFSDLNLTLSKADRLGLVAANSTGKITPLDCLATAWITEPHVLLLDEPTNHLDIDSPEPFL